MDKNYDYSEEKSSPENDSGFRERVESKTKEFTRSGRDVAVKEIENMGDALHRACDRLHEENDFFADVADTFVQRFDRLGDYVKNHSTREIISDVNDYSKKNPYLVVGGLFAAGLAASRFIKAGSSPDGRESEARGQV